MGAAGPKIHDCKPTTIDNDFHYYYDFDFDRLHATSNECALWGGGGGDPALAVGDEGSGGATGDAGASADGNVGSYTYGNVGPYAYGSVDAYAYGSVDSRPSSAGADRGTVRAYRRRVRAHSI